MTIKIGKNKEKRMQQGLSLIEASMVLALSAVVVAGAVMYYGSSSESAKVQRAQSQLGGIQSAVASLYATQASYSGLNNVVLKNSRALPSSYFSGTGDLLSPWNGKVTVVAIDPGNTYKIEFESVPANACVKLAVTDPGTSVRKITIGNNNIVKFPASLADASSFCNATGDADVTETVAYIVG
ncbi:type 4 pilus major pilin [Aeromonas sp. MdU4]|uniref:type 4 pilus major pilin n=1 Tax=Aeromonas sp. MdU4 TaxID=3342819 RepID=UPI0035B7B232